MRACDYTVPSTINNLVLAEEHIGICYLSLCEYWYHPADEIHENLAVLSPKADPYVNSWICNQEVLLARETKVSLAFQWCTFFTPVSDTDT